MMHLLAQSGGNFWLNPGVWKAAGVVIFLLFSLLGGVAKKISERNAKRAAELARERRRDEMLRTGRDETGAFVDVTRSAVLDAPATPQTSEADEAKARLQALAERRRRELQEMMKRAAAGGAGAKPGPQVRPQPAAGPQARRSPTPPQQQPSRKQLEQQARRQREQQEKLEKAARRANRQESTPAAPPLEVMRSTPPLGSPSPMPAENAYQQPGTMPQNSRRNAAGNVGAALARVAGTPGAQPTSAAEWRKAIILNELFSPPASMRAPDERMF